MADYSIPIHTSDLTEKGLSIRIDESNQVNAKENARIAEENQQREKEGLPPLPLLPIYASVQDYLIAVLEPATNDIGTSFERDRTVKISEATKAADESVQQQIRDLLGLDVFGNPTGGK